MDSSILAKLSGVIAPVFAPLGIGDWRLVTSLITGVMAKESVVSTLKVLFAGVSLTTVLTTSAAASMLVFCLLYVPCVASIAAIKRELGGKWAAGLAVWQCAVAWVAALAVRAIMLAGGIA